MATVVAPDRLFTVDEYFEIEVASDRKHEFNRGKISVMTGADFNHIDICWNLNALLGQLLKGTRFRGFGNDMRIEGGLGHYYAYPDLSIAARPVTTKRIRGTATLVNPMVIIEVLSPSTEATDRGEKFNEYTAIESLREYFLISADVAQVERWSRDPNGRWISSVVRGLEGTMVVDSIPCSLALSEIYHEVSLPDIDNQVNDA